MAKQEKVHLSKDHWLEQEGIGWVSSESSEDFSPQIPEAEFNLRIARAKELLAKHGIDAMILFAEENKYYYGGYRDAALMFTDRWRHCFIF